jgi:hypothetical protein
MALNEGPEGPRRDLIAPGIEEDPGKPKPEEKQNLPGSSTGEAVVRRRRDRPRQRKGQ